MNPFNFFRSNTITKEPTVHDFKFSNGDEVRDRITKYEGVIIGRTQWLTNCNTYLVKSRELKDGKPMDAVNFDEPSLDLVAKEVMPEVKNKTGGPTESVSPTNRL